MTVLPMVSVCILNRNYGRYLRQTIDSALNQEPGPYHLTEVLVVDDGSTDDSLAICASYENRLRVVAQPHAGFGATLTNAIKHARGEWVALLDADDWFTPDKLATVATAITHDSLLVQHWEHVTDAAGGPLLNRPHPGGNTSTLVVQRRAALDLLPVTNEAFFHVLDHVGRGVKLTDPLVHYRVHDANMTDRINPGVFQDYLRCVNLAIANRLRTLALTPPPWGSGRALRRLAWHYAATAAGNAREAAVQRRNRWPATTAALTALIWAAIARRGLSDALYGARRAIAMQSTRPLR